MFSDITVLDTINANQPAYFNSGLIFFQHPFLGTLPTIFSYVFNFDIKMDISSFSLISMTSIT
ncbi:hypothetical protein AAW12_21310 [Sphingobacterium sp. Ag1]|nr:hypothetical protein AAW12_21310 [Sphingobacterium sp. Ag1]